MEQMTIPSRVLGQMLLEEFCPRCYWIGLRCEWKLQRARDLYELPKAPAGREGCKDCARLERLVEVVRG